MSEMPDLQKSRDTRNIAIDKVGVKDIRYPIVVMDKSKVQQHTVARINMYVDLPHQFKGTHMSRFIEILNEYRGEITMRNMGTLLQAMKDRLAASCAHMELEFPYFIEKEAPVSRARGLMEYTCRLIGTLDEEKDFVLAVTVPVTSLCPCSREISARGAHNQRCEIEARVRIRKMLWIEELVRICENAASAPAPTSSCGTISKRSRAITDSITPTTTATANMPLTDRSRFNHNTSVVGATMPTTIAASTHNFSAAP